MKTSSLLASTALLAVSAVRGTIIVEFFSDSLCGESLGQFDNTEFNGHTCWELYMPYGSVKVITCDQADCQLNLYADGQCATPPVLLVDSVWTHCYTVPGGFNSWGSQYGP